MFQIEDDYPFSVQEVLDDKMKFHRGVISAAKRYAEAHPWRGSNKERASKLERFYAEICTVYGVSPPKLDAQNLGFGDSGSSAYMPVYRTVYLRGRFSVVTALHELAHHLGKREWQACRWSLNLFCRVWPTEFSKCFADGHMLRRSGPKFAVDHGPTNQS